MSEANLEISSNFQHFLNVLSEIEYQNCEKNHDECEVDDLLSSKQPKCYSFAPKNDNSKLKMKTKVQNRKILRQPGFVYRAKLRKTVLDNNLWEYSCSRRVLRPPLFRYHTRNVALTSSSTNYILEDLTSLSLGCSKEEKCHPEDVEDSNDGELMSRGNWYENHHLARKRTDNQNPEHPRSNSGSTDSGCSPVLNCSKDKHPPVTFLPLSSSSFVQHPKYIQVTSPRKGHLVQPGKLNILQLNSVIKQKENPQNSAKDLGIVMATDREFGFFHDNCNHNDRPTSYRQLSETNSKTFTSEFAEGKTVSPPKINLSPRENGSNSLTKNRKPLSKSCSYEARLCEQEISVEELSSYIEDLLVLPQKMSTMAEMMYT